MPLKTPWAIGTRGQPIIASHESTSVFGHQRSMLVSRRSLRWFSDYIILVALLRLARRFPADLQANVGVLEKSNRDVLRGGCSPADRLGEQARLALFWNPANRRAGTNPHVSSAGSCGTSMMW